VHEHLQFASSDSSFAVITGPNMVGVTHVCAYSFNLQSGKSTYLKQVALLQIIAQCGVYVPAEYASVRVVEQIFGRFGHNDDLNNDNSAFMLEVCVCIHIIGAVLWCR
jgi:DNA mismatch repair protein MSH4